MNHLSLQELRFQHRVFQHYLQHIVNLRECREQEIPPDGFLNSEISRTEHRLADLSILIQRYRPDDGEFSSQIT